MRLLCLSLALAIIYTIAIVRAPIVEARAAKPDEKAPPEHPPEKPPPEHQSEEDSSSSSSEWDMSKPAKPVTSEEAAEAFALSIPTINGGLYWTEKAFQTMYNNSMHLASKIKDNPWLAAIVNEYITKSVTW